MRTIATTFAAAVLGLAGSYAHAEDFSARLTGFQEVPAAILSPGTGELHLSLDRRAGTLSYTLTYGPLSSAVTQSHIHFGKVHVAGGIMVFFCSNLAGSPAGTPACPENGGTVSGTITADSVLGPATQNVNPKDFEALVTALTTHTAYANVHTTKFAPGEIRGQIRDGRRNGGDHDDGHSHQH